MRKKKYAPEEIVAKLREAEVLIAQGRTVADAARQIGVTEQSYYRWRREYGGMRSDQAKRLKELERENARLRRAVSDLTLDKVILTEAARGNS
jgi:transposase-like protein